MYGIAACFCCQWVQEEPALERFPWDHELLDDLKVTAGFLFAPGGGARREGLQAKPAGYFGVTHEAGAAGAEAFPWFQENRLDARPVGLIVKRLCRCGWRLCSVPEKHYADQQ
jgi:hypothetical protein